MLTAAEASRTHISTQLHLQTDGWSETERKTKAATDSAGDGEEDPDCSSKDPFSNQQNGAAGFLNHMDKGYKI